MNDAIFIAVLKNFVEKTLNKPFGDIAPLLTTENNEIKPDASEILNNLFVAHIDDVKANIDITQHPKHKELLENKKIEYTNKQNKEIAKVRAELETQLNTLKNSKTQEEIAWSEKIAAEKLSGDARVQEANAKLEKYIADETAKARKSLLQQKLIENLPTKDFAPIMPKAINLGIKEAMESRIHDFSEKDGKFYALDANKNLITRSNGHALTLSDIGRDILAELSTPLVQQPSGGAGNTNAIDNGFGGW